MRLKTRVPMPASAPIRATIKAAACLRTKALEKTGGSGCCACVIRVTQPHPTRMNARMQGAANIYELGISMILRRDSCSPRVPHGKGACSRPTGARGSRRFRWNTTRHFAAASPVSPKPPEIRRGSTSERAKFRARIPLDRCRSDYPPVVGWDHLDTRVLERVPNGSHPFEWVVHHPLTRRRCMRLSRHVHRARRPHESIGKIIA